MPEKGLDIISSTDLTALAGKTMHGEGGEKIGKIVDVYESTEGADGTFVTVSTGLFGGHASLVPLAKATMKGNDVVVPYNKDLVKDAPRVEEDRLYQHYNLTGTPTTPATTGTTGAVAGVAAGAAAATAVPRGTDREDLDGDGVYNDVKDTAVGQDTSGLTTDDAMTRSEERLQVGTQRVETGRARLRKRIVTENVAANVQLSDDEVKVVREPITEANMPKAMDGPALSEEEHEVVLHAEKPVVSKETVPVERVRLGVDTVTEEQTVTEQVRKEQIETDLSDVDTTTGKRR